MFEPRIYRTQMERGRFASFEASYLETDLWIGISPRQSVNPVCEFVREYIIVLRKDLEAYSQKNPEFSTSFSPLPFDSTAPRIVQEMLKAAQQAGIGPMGAVAGAVAEDVGKIIKSRFSLEEIVVENGGDIYVDLCRPVLIGIFAGDSPLSKKTALQILPENTPLGVCTSSGRVGHSFSFGKAHAVTIACAKTAVADALATAFGNKIQSAADLDPVITETEIIKEILSAVFIIDDKIGIRGQLEVRLFKT